MPLELSENSEEASKSKTSSVACDGQRHLKRFTCSSFWILLEAICCANRTQACTALPGQGDSNKRQDGLRGANDAKVLFLRYLQGTNAAHRRARDFQMKDCSHA
jgi:hypothetical protein